MIDPSKKTHIPWMVSRRKQFVYYSFASFIPHLSLPYWPKIAYITLFSSMFSGGDYYCQSWQIASMEFSSQITNRGLLPLHSSALATLLFLGRIHPSTNQGWPLEIWWEQTSLGHAGYGPFYLISHYETLLICLFSSNLVFIEKCLSKIMFLKLAFHFSRSKLKLPTS